VSGAGMVLLESFTSEANVDIIAWGLAIAVMALGVIVNLRVHHVPCVTEDGYCRNKIRQRLKLRSLAREKRRRKSTDIDAPLDIVVPTTPSTTKSSAYGKSRWAGKLVQVTANRKKLAAAGGLTLPGPGSGSVSTTTTKGGRTGVLSWMAVKDKVVEVQKKKKDAYLESLALIRVAPLYFHLKVERRERFTV
jgi:hypothetical protein